MNCSKDMALESAIKYFNGDCFAAHEWLNNYATRDSKGELMEVSPRDMVIRIAKNLVSIGQETLNDKEEDIVELLDNAKYGARIADNVKRNFGFEDALPDNEEALFFIGLQLNRYVTNAYSSNASVDFVTLQKHVNLATRISDVFRLAGYKARIGVSALNMQEMLTSMLLPYTNEEAKSLTAKVKETVYGSTGKDFDASEYIHPDVTEHRPEELVCDVVRFQNKKEKWVAFVGLHDGNPYEIFTGLQDDEEGILLPKTVTSGKIIKRRNADGTSRYDFQFENKRGYKTTVEGLSEKFNPEYWNYAKLISAVLRYRMPIKYVIKMVSSLQLGGNEDINTWKVGVERALKKYVSDSDAEV